MTVHYLTKMTVLINGVMCVVGEPMILGDSEGSGTLAYFITPNIPTHFFIR